MPTKKEFERGGTVGEIREIRGYSTELNTQRQVGGEKPMFSGKEDPGMTKPERVMEKSVPVANGRR
jgi:hypothetical protein